MIVQQQRMSLPPLGWDRRRIKHHVNGFFGGGTPRKDNESFWRDGTIPWISPKDMKRRLLDDAEDWITSEALNQSATSIVPKGSVLMVVRSGILKHSLPVALNKVPVALNQDMKAFRFRRTLSPEFFTYWIEGQSSQLLLEWRQIGATVDNIDVDGMLNAPIALPDREIQKAIVDFLDHEVARIDQLIEKKQRLVKLLREKERTLIAEMFAALEAEGWRVRHLGKMRNGAGFPIELQGDATQEIGFFKVKHLKTHGLDAAIVDTDDTVSDGTAKSLRATVFPSGTIVFAKIGAALLLGRFSMLGRPACIDNNMAAFIPNERLIDPNYALLGLSQIDMTRMVQPGAVPSLSTEAFYNYWIPLPSKDTQIAFVNTFRLHKDLITKVVSTTDTSIDRLREFRAALITAAVTGEIDVTTWGRQGQINRRLDWVEQEMSSAEVRV